jgi:type II secretory ATPase GspE/PulE/Tfp pilus assembly ATPase PilB-like protein
MMKDTWMEKVWAENIKLYRWKWCEYCNNSWYKGRIWIYEIISLNEKLREMIREWANTEEIIAQARKMDMITMKEDWILKALKWFTTIEEVIRVV